MRTALLVLTASALPLLGCKPPALVVPDQRIPHQLAVECRTTILVKHPSGQVESQKVTVPAGWWVGAPQIVEGK